MYCLAIANLWLCIDEGEDSFRRRLSHLHLCEPVGKLLHGLKKVASVGEEGKDRPRAQGAKEELKPAEGQGAAEGEA